MNQMSGSGIKSGTSGGGIRRRRNTASAPALPLSLSLRFSPVKLIARAKIRYNIGFCCFCLIAAPANS
ncbi:hypothetical protein TYRP_019211 [Tyrophagus putrescentiae]|nr:hypothetical protein TYRP_019211 [Tyrophagus putrescentiae]